MEGRAQPSDPAPTIILAWRSLPKFTGGAAESNANDAQSTSRLAQRPLPVHGSERSRVNETVTVREVFSVNHGRDGVDFHNQIFRLPKTARHKRSGGRFAGTINARALTRRIGCMEG